MTLAPNWDQRDWGLLKDDGITKIAHRRVYTIKYASSSEKSMEWKVKILTVVTYEEYHYRAF